MASPARPPATLLAAVAVLIGLALAGLCAALDAPPPAPAAGNTSKLVHPGPGGKLVYVPDDKGNTIPDFSNAGHMGGGVRIPDVPLKVTLQPAAGTSDDTARIQAAIDQVSKLPRGADGLRGAVLLARGEYRIGGALRIAAGGVVLRGQGAGEKDTVLIATGKSARAIINIGGAEASPQAARKDGPKVAVADAYVPVGARKFSVHDASGFKAGDTVVVTRNGNQEWIHFIGMDDIKPIGKDRRLTQWSPFALRFERIITAVSGNTIAVDAPIVCAIEAKWGGGEVYTHDDTRIANVGVEFLRAVSEYDKTKTAKSGDKAYESDEDHATYLVSFGNVRNAWGRDLVTVHFAHGVATFSGGAKAITVQDSSALDPVSVLTGGRRYAFNMGGSLLLVQRCYARGARHAFVLGSRLTGPNVFLDCQSEEDYATSEPHHRWSSGGLYDNVNGNIQFADRGAMGSGHGWAGANYVAWNCTGHLVCEGPPTAQNWAIGFVGQRSPGPFKRADGYWESEGRHVEPRSLYLAQLADRLGPQAVANISGGQPAPRN